MYGSGGGEKNPAAVTLIAVTAAPWAFFVVPPPAIPRPTVILPLPPFLFTAFSMLIIDRGFLVPFPPSRDTDERPSPRTELAREEVDGLDEGGGGAARLPRAVRIALVP